MAKVIGIDLGGTAVKFGLFESSGMLLEKWSIPTPQEDGNDSVLKAIAESILQKISGTGIQTDDIAGAGLAVPAPVTGGGDIPKVVNINWEARNISNDLGKYLPYPVTALNDANAAALGELWMGAGQGVSSLVMVTLGTGVGGGVIIDGRPLTGRNGAAGEIGHICVDPDEEESCNCGNKGCLEQYSSATGFVRIAKRLIREAKEHGTQTILDEENVDSRLIMDACAKGDTAAMQALSQMTDILGRTLASVACVADPEVFVIGGGVSNAGELLRKPIEEAYRKYAFHAHRGTDIVLACLGNDAGIYGAAYYVIQALSKA